MELPEGERLITDVVKENVKTYLKASGKPPTTASKDAGFQNGIVIQRLIQGEHVNITIRTLQRIAHALGVNTLDLV